MTRQSRATTEQAIRVVLLVLIVCDVFFIGRHLVHAATWRLPSRNWSIEHDGGYAEWWQYSKYLVLSGVLFTLAFRQRSMFLVGWGMLFAFMMLDDALRLHERSGLFLADWAQLPSFGGLRGRDIGEILFASAIGMVVLPVLMIGYVFGSSEAREITKDLAILLMAIVTCGVGIDALHEIMGNRQMKVVMTMIEDGGEMLLLSSTVFYALQHLLGWGAVKFRPMTIVLMVLAKASRKSAITKA